MKCYLYFKKVLLVTISLLCSLALQAQTREEIDIQQWPRGLVTLTTGEVVEGAVTFYRSQDIITVLHADSTLSSLSPVNVTQFLVSDEYNNRKHLFKSVYWDQGRENSDFKKPTFFEEILQGNVTLLMRESYSRRGLDPYLTEIRNTNAYDPLGIPIGGQFADQIKPVFYVMEPEGKVVTLQKVRKDFLNYCGKKATIIKDFARKQKLSFELPQDFIAIVHYYNTL
ncbi:hypothetical protein [Pontibacter fetidus]|uniref:Uncharacterized protein n=1 Tax=Pontibacter fetidus TaxID=2700082 RepID=A0A6B2H634_9BACT|nr:hypothetical protein [Pontibacter fetidus]NDK56226.1 hypothetical protein [Pontibacter fetidus]